MRFALLDNAKNSLQLAIAFYGYPSNYEYYLCSESDEITNLKLALIFLENALELLIKLILSSEDKLKIYVNPSKEKVAAAEDYIRLRPDSSFDEAMIRIANAKTISYSKAVSLYAEKNKCKKKTVDVLNRIGFLRNCVTHLGIYTDEDCEQIEDYLVLGFGIVIFVLYAELEEIDSYYKNYLDIIDLVESFFYVPAQRTITAQKTEALFRQTLYEALHSFEFRRFAEVEGFELYIQSSEAILDSNNDPMILDVEYNGGETYIGEFHTKYVMLENLTIVYELEGQDIQFIFDHNRSELIRFHPGRFETFAEETDDGSDNYFDWSLDEHIAEAEVHNLSLASMITVLKNMLLDMRECQLKTN